MGNPDLPTPPHILEKLVETVGEAAHQPLFRLARHCRAQARAGRLLRAPLRREAQSRPRGRRHARLEGGLRQHGAGDHRAGRRGARAEPELPDPRLRLPDGGRRHPPRAGRAGAGILRRARARGAPFDPEADRRHPLLSGQPDGLGRDARFLSRRCRLRAAERHLHPLRPRLCRGLFRRPRPAAFGAAGAGRDRGDGGVHLHVEDVLDGGAAGRLRGRQRAADRGARRA